MKTASCPGLKLIKGRKSKPTTLVEFTVCIGHVKKIEKVFYCDERIDVFETKYHIDKNVNIVAAVKFKVPYKPRILTSPLARIEFKELPESQNKKPETK